MGHVIAVYSQTTWRARRDDGTETTAGWAAPVDTAWSQLPGQTFRLRIAVAESAGRNGNVLPELQWSLNGAGWVTLTGGGTVAAVLSANVVDDEVTTQQVTGGAFSAGVVDENAIMPNVNIAGNTATELEWVLTVDSAAVAVGDVITFRVVDGGALLDFYPVTPSLTVGAKVFGHNGTALLPASNVLVFDGAVLRPAGTVTFT